ncbi:HDOD domain-containing protein [Rhodoferax sp.]|uniref:HDOD domain-containing protein n=1 Tax=Rhodoferax sp. TaxID=50421 RepID=UPI00374CC721
MDDILHPDAALTPPTYLGQPLPDLAAWTRYFIDAEIPVLASTAAALEVLRAKEDDVDAAMLAKEINSDPLMSIKLMAYVASLRKPGNFDDNDESSKTETVTSALVMLGIAPFFRHFGPQPTLEDQLHDQPEALAGVLELVQRAERSRLFALGFAVHRSDMDVDVILQAAFLHDFAEMLLGCHAPTLALAIANAQQADTTLRSATIQRSVLNIELDDLAQELMKRWHLPALLVRISDARHADQANVRNVVLAVQVARHTMHGWDNAALPDDVDDIAELLNASPRIALAYLHKIDRGL